MGRLNCFLGLLIFMESCWRLPWIEQRFASDASEMGCGIAVGARSQEDCASIGRQSERRRFKLAHATQARAHAFAAYDLLEYLPDNADCRESVWVQDDRFVVILFDFYMRRFGASRIGAVLQI